MTSTKNKVFDPLPPVHRRPYGPDPLSPLWTSTRGRHEIHIAFLKRLVQFILCSVVHSRLLLLLSGIHSPRRFGCYQRATRLCSTNCLKLIFFTMVGLEAPLSSFLEGAL